MQKPIGEIVQGEANIMETLGQPVENVAQLATARGLMCRNQLIIRPAHLLIELDVRRATQTASLGVFMKDATNEKRIISHVCTEQESLLGGRAGQGDEHVGNVFVYAIVDLVR